MPLWSAICAAISAATRRPFTADAPQSVGGGCVNSAYRLEGSEGRVFFVKLNEARLAEMFAAEAAGLAEIAASRTLRVPLPVCQGVAEGQAYLVLEWLDLAGEAAPEALGRGLAAMHRVTAARFGWRRDNTIGATPQLNEQLDDWVTFWRRNRLDFQLELAAERGIGRAVVKSGERLSERLAAFFSGYRPAPSLLHGDLWSGNQAATRAGEPVVFDPAVYYGDRETDLAMTELFGGFSPRFYAAYREAWPLDPGYAVRRDLYNLYHVLNHFNLFGGGYGAQAGRMLERLLAEVAS